ncbi:MAG: serine hydrolase domain-containing protein [Planctomycetota bacterium]|nr:serine hydrolase domain-containing protein [Planctomycetota bacterium]
MPARLFCYALIAMMLVSVSAGSSLAALPPVKPLTDAEAKEYKLDRTFYKKCTRVQDILIATSEKVSDYAHQETAYLFDMMMKSIKPEIAQRIREQKVLCVLVGYQEFTSEVPQFKSDKTGKELDFYNWRSRGFLTRRDNRPVVLFAEEDVLEYEGGMQLESILVHEFGHVIHGAGFDKALQERLTQTYERAKAKGIWNDGRAAQRYRRISSTRPVSLLDSLVASFPDQSPALIRKCLDAGDILVNGKPTHAAVKVTSKDKVLIVFGGPKECYAHKNRAEYWAEVLQCWYDTNRTMDHDHNHIHTRKQLKAYDPVAAKLCEDVLGNAAWRFVSPRKRAGQGHLAGFDPKTAPRVVDPEHIKEAANDYYDKYWKEYWQRLSDKHAKKISAEKYQHLLQLVASQVKEKKIAGAQIVVGGDGLAPVSRNFGVRTVSGNQPVDDDTLFCIGSVSKMMSAALIMKLVEAGKLELDVPVDRWLKQYGTLRLKDGGDAERAPTLRELLCHRSGIYSQRDEMTRNQSRWIRDFQLTLQESVNGIAREPLSTAPGTRFAYSGAAYCVLGRVAEVATGMPVEMLLQQHVCRPLQLARTTYFPHGTHSNIAAGHHLDQDQLKVSASTPHLLGKRQRFALIGGSIYSPARELARFAAMLLDEGKFEKQVVLSRKSWQEMTATQSERSTGPYGFGLGLRHDTQSKELVAFSHGGSLSGFISYVVVDLSTRRFAVINYTGPRQKKITSALVAWARL